MIYIMTPCFRTENLVKMKVSIPKECTWIVVYDNKVGTDHQCISDVCIFSDKTGYYGNPLRNEFLEKFSDRFTKDDWVYILDDDNLIHPEWYQSVMEIIETDEFGFNFINWGQVERLPAVLNPKVGDIDTACYMYKPKKFKNVRYKLEYSADGIFAEKIFQKSKPSTIFRDLCYYNILDPKPPVVKINSDVLESGKVNPTLLLFLSQNGEL